jgi:hypothetical protein
VPEGGGTTMMGPNTDNAPPLALPMTFFVTGLAGLVALVADLLTHVDALMAFAYGDGAVLAATHLMTLGFVSMAMMGAMYQLVPVVLNTKLWSVRLGAVHYAIFVPGVTLMVGGFFGAGIPWLVAGGSLVVSAVAVFLYTMGRTLARAPQWDIPGWYLATSLSYLALTVSLGWLLAYNVARPFLPVLSALPVHMVLGGVGWFTLTLMGVSYKLLPMFSLTHVKPRYGWWVYALVNAAIWVVGVGSWWTGVAVVVGGILALAGLGLYLTDVRALWRGRLRRQADPPVYLALAGSIGGMATVVAAVAAWLWTRAYVVPFFLFFFGWLGMSILGYLQKIVPFLVWLHRYSADIGSRPVPRMKDILRDEWSWIISAVYVVGLTAAVTGLVTGIGLVVTGGLTVMGGAVLGLVSIVVYVLVGQPESPRHESL